MKIKRELQPPSTTIQAFAEKNDLTMKIVERDPAYQNVGRFYAKFEGTEVKGDGVLTTVFGNGSTEDEAIHAYAREISETTLSIQDPNGRRLIKVPRLTREKL